MMHRRFLAPSLGAVTAAIASPSKQPQAQREVPAASQRQLGLQMALSRGPARKSWPSQSPVRCDSSAADKGEKEDEEAIPLPLTPGDRPFSLQELRTHSGVIKGLPILTSLLGRVYDVSAASDMFGPEGCYSMWAGRDCTVSLAVMSFENHLIDRFDYNLNQERRKTLAEWILYFDIKYGQPIGRLCHPQHPLSLDDLPRPTVIPFGGKANIKNT